MYNYIDILFAGWKVEIIVGAGVKVRGARDSWTFMDAEVKGICPDSFFLEDGESVVG